MTASAEEISRLLATRLRADCEALRAAFGPPGSDRVRCCWVDDLLPPEIFAAALDGLPRLDAMERRDNAKERKYVTAQLDRLDGMLRTLVHGFSSQRVADAIASIMCKPCLEFDPQHYNGGITTMLPGDFMCPHLANSHDYSRTRRREVVLHYSVSPHWRGEFGGHLEIWNSAVTAPQCTAEFRPNRLTIMETKDHSWHSISPVTGPMPRINVTTYFYAPNTEQSPLRLTRFAPWPGQKMRGMLFNGEFHLRTAAARVLRGGRLAPNRHVYQGSQERT